MKTIEIYWEDLHPDKQQELIDKGFWHENISVTPLAIIEKINTNEEI